MPNLYCGESPEPTQPLGIVSYSGFDDFAAVSWQTEEAFACAVHSDDCHTDGFFASQNSSDSMPLERRRRKILDGVLLFSGQMTRQSMECLAFAAGGALSAHTIWKLGTKGHLEERQHLLYLMFISIKLGGYLASGEAQTKLMLCRDAIGASNKQMNIRQVKIIDLTALHKTTVDIGYCCMSKNGEGELLCTKYLSPSQIETGMYSIIRSNNTGNNAEGKEMDSIKGSGSSVGYSEHFLHDPLSKCDEHSKPGCSHAVGEISSLDNNNSKASQSATKMWMSWSPMISQSKWKVASIVAGGLGLAGNCALGLTITTVMMLKMLVSERNVLGVAIAMSMMFSSPKIADNVQNQTYIVSKQMREELLRLALNQQLPNQYAQLASSFYDAELESKIKVRAKFLRCPFIIDGRQKMYIGMKAQELDGRHTLFNSAGMRMFNSFDEKLSCITVDQISDMTQQPSDNAGDQEQPNIVNVSVPKHMSAFFSSGNKIKVNVSFNIDVAGRLKPDADARPEPEERQPEDNGVNILSIRRIPRIQMQYRVNVTKFETLTNSRCAGVLQAVENDTLERLPGGLVGLKMLTSEYHENITTGVSGVKMADGTKSTTTDDFVFQTEDKLLIEENNYNISNNGQIDLRPLDNSILVTWYKRHREYRQTTLIHWTSYGEVECAIDVEYDREQIYKLLEPQIVYAREIAIQTRSNPPDSGEGYIAMVVSLIGVLTAKTFWNDLIDICESLLNKMLVGWAIIKLRGKKSDVSDDGGYERKGRLKIAITISALTIFLTFLIPNVAVLIRAINADNWTLQHVDTGITNAYDDWMQVAARIKDNQTTFATKAQATCHDDDDGNCRRDSKDQLIVPIAEISFESTTDALEEAIIALIIYIVLALAMLLITSYRQSKKFRKEYKEKKKNVQRDGRNANIVQNVHNSNDRNRQLDSVVVLTSTNSQDT